ncbi:MAG: precorrin-6y C5,15-methyltransferase (decarboxylating) subunit CbiE [Hyphomicrobiales bacterium]|nr:precorrin-6y C5,15-methyltransferase (decarboxylating) subunit CbiE [Hyphomicrobiales bacterium]
MKPWLNVVGIGEDGLAGLTPAARQALDRAELVAGGTRHLDLAEVALSRRLAWPRPLEAAFPEILARRGSGVCVLASGDPLYFGVGSTLLKAFAGAEILFFPGLSSFSLAAARLGWALQDSTCLSLHGRTLERLIPQLQPGARILALSWDQTTPAAVAALLNSRGFGDTIMTICACMNGPREDLRSTRAIDFSLTGIDPLNLIALEIPADTRGRALPLASGLQDDWFEHDGQLTRSDMRAITLAALRPHPGELLWDIGAGSGAIGIEWMLRGPSLRALALEPRPDRAARIRRNALNLGVPDLQIIEVAAPQGLAALPQPDAIFIGGGAGAPGVIELAWQRLKPDGRLVINAVTLQTQTLLQQHHSALGGEMVQISLAHAEPLGRFHGWRPAMPIVQWRITKARGEP